MNYEENKLYLLFIVIITYIIFHGWRASYTLFVRWGNGRFRHTSSEIQNITQ